MGNSASNANSHRDFDDVPAQIPHRSLRTKKKSLELPDLASLSLSAYHHRGRTNNPPKSASIPIPDNPAQPRTRPALPYPSADALSVTPQPPPPPHASPAPYFRPPRPHDLALLPPPPARPRFAQETVLSSIPIALGKAAVSPDDPAPVPVLISWHGGGNSVVLARAGDDDWKGRQPMARSSPTSDVHSTTVALLPGTHHIRFIVDDQWRVADDLPTAVDDQGSLANYVAVPLSYSPPAPSNFPASQSYPAKHPTAGHSFWSASSADTDDHDPPPPSRIYPSSSHPPNHNHKPHHHHHHNLPAWTTILPPELIEAAREEEVYLQASAGQLDPHPSHHRHRTTTHVNGFIPAPNIPPAPGLPRHLDKLILNSRVVASNPGSGGASGSPRPSSRGSAPPPSAGSSGRTRAKDTRDRDRRDRERRDQRRAAPSGLVPPPPSEDGSGEGLNVNIVSATPDEPSAVVEATSSESASASTSSAGTGVTTPATAPSTPAIPAAAPTPSRPIDTSLPALTDDASVLPVPSHVVLHHLSTSAIRNGVLAVGNTTRYRKKYLTTIYYKPT